MASLFFKRYVFCCLTSSLYALTMRNKQFDMRIQNVMILDDENLHSWLPSFSLKNTEGLAMAGDRNRWRSYVIRTLFAENISIMLDHLARYTKASKAMLWENTLIYIAWVYNNWLSEEQSPSQRELIESDYAFIIRDADGSHFNRASNPFLHSGRKYEENERTRRQTCCLYYRTGDGTCCKTCPRTKAN